MSITKIEEAWISGGPFRLEGTLQQFGDDESLAKLRLDCRDYHELWFDVGLPTRSPYGEDIACQVHGRLPSSLTTPGMLITMSARVRYETDNVKVTVYVPGRNLRDTSSFTTLDGETYIVFTVNIPSSVLTAGGQL